MALIRPLNGAMNWVMDAILKFCSFGWVSFAHNDFFIWQSQDAKKFKWIAPASADDIRDIEIKVLISKRDFSLDGLKLFFPTI